MVRTIVYFFLASIVLGTIATPGLAELALLVVPLAVLWLIWRIALAVVTHGRPFEAIVHTKPSHLLGPGGADDSFTAYDFDEDEYEYLPEASSRSKAA